MANPIMTAQIISEGEIDRSLWKILVLGALLAGASLLAVYCFYRFLAGQDGFFFYAALSSLFFLALVVLNAVFIKVYSKLAVAVFLSAFLPLILFYPAVDYFLAAGAVMFFFLLSAAGRRGQRTLNNSLQVRFFLTAKSIVPPAVTGLLLFFAVIFFTQYFNLETRVFNGRLQQSFINQLVGAGEPVLAAFLPGFSASQPTDETLKLFVEKQIPSLVPNYNRFPPDLKAKVFNESFRAFRDGLTAAVGSFSGAKPLTENLNEIVARYLDSLSFAGRLAVAAGVTVIFFLVIRSLAGLFHWLIEFAAFLIFKILLAANFAVIGTENRSREFVTLT